jgi:hypothetical protein
MSLRISLFLLVISLATACSIFKKDTFQGTWTITISGDYSDSIDFVVDEKNSFNFSKVIDTQGQSYDAKFAGKIAEDGSFTCDVMVMGYKVADFSGKVNFENGSGKWTGQGMGGSWTAVKK